MSKNVAVFVDVANIFYAAKAAGVDIDYVTLLKAASAGRDLVRAYAYTGLDPDNENQRNFHDFLRRSNYKVVSKDIRKYGDGKVKANLDIELVVDMMKTARNLDIAIVVSGDGDFAPAIRAVQEQGVRVEVISFRGNTSSDLIEVADQFTDIVQLARVEKGSRSGRRVADGDDLSMTEVPDKQTEGTGAGRGRGRPRGRGRDAEPVAASDARSRGRGRLAPVSATERIEPAATGTVVALPGERLSRVAGSLTEADLAKAEVFTLDDLDADDAPVGSAGEAGDAGNGAASLDEDGEPRRRRRRGGRGRGRGRGREDGALEGDAEPEAGVARASSPQLSAAEAEEAELDAEEDEIEAAMSAAAAAATPAPAPRGPRTTPFGSVWDSQLGTPTAPAARTTPAPAPLDDEDFDEPEIPEYLIAEQRRNAQGGGGNRGARGGRAAYQSAVSRERYGGGRGAGGLNRYPDVSGRSQVQQDRPPRDDRNYQRGGDRPAPRTPAPSAPRSSASNEPWSDVPPELEAMLRAQVAAKPVPSLVPASTASAEPLTSAPDAATATGRPRAARTSTARAPRTPRASSADAAETAAVGAAGASSDIASEAAPAPKTRAAAKPRTPTRKTATAASATVDEAAPAAATEAATATVAKPRATRKPAAKAAAAAAPADAAGASDGEAPAPKRRTTRKTATADPT